MTIILYCIVVYTTVGVADYTFLYCIVYTSTSVGVADFDCSRIGIRELLHLEFLRLSYVKCFLTSHAFPFKDPETNTYHPSKFRISFGLK